LLVLITSWNARVFIVSNSSTVVGYLAGNCCFVFIEKGVYRLRVTYTVSLVKKNYHNQNGVLGAMELMNAAISIFLFPCIMQSEYKE
jgi:hypothetical protein